MPIRRPCHRTRPEDLGPRRRAEPSPDGSSHWPGCLGANAAGRSSQDGRLSRAHRAAPSRRSPAAIPAEIRSVAMTMQTIYVELLDEGVDAWRPVEAVADLRKSFDCPRSGRRVRAGGSCLAAASAVNGASSTMGLPSWPSKSRLSSGRLACRRCRVSRQPLGCETRLGDACGVGRMQSCRERRSCICGRDRCGERRTPRRLRWIVRDAV